ncbi:MAG: ribosome small subunit-dependent GTPase A, partial [Bacteroidota bacterium]|nr:ribosome small subunit-dependent GTPase A [Bacteroidota bacterium]
MKGIVLRSVGSSYDILGTDGTLLKARLKGKFKLEDKKLTNPIAVGDEVICIKEGSDTSEAIIDTILPRRNYIIRASPHKTEHSHLIATNIDLAILVASLVYPETSYGFIDRFLLAAESFEINAALVLNKIDLYDKDIMQKASHIKELYTQLDYPVYLVSATHNEGIDALKRELKDKKTLFSGHSGVGKSSLLNALDVNITQKTLPISNFANKGVHTTTFAEMFPIEGNTFFIDTPGIKEFGLYEIERSEISHFFPEMRRFLGNCKFNSCMHINEPGCVIIEKLKSGEIAQSRYKSYLSML